MLKRKHLVYFREPAITWGCQQADFPLVLSVLSGAWGTASSLVVYFIQGNQPEAGGALIL